MISRLVGMTLLLANMNDVSAQTVTPDQPSYVVGSDVIVNFSGGAGNATDWIGIYEMGETPDGSPAALQWFYTNGTQSSGGGLTSGSVTFSSPNLSPGVYSVWFLANDGYTQIAGPTDLTITAAPPEMPKWVVPSFRRRHAVVGVPYQGKISAYASSDTTSFLKVSGPEWLTVSASGDISGSPVNGDVGLSMFTLRATNSEGSVDATMKIHVFAPGTESVTELKMLSFNFWHGFGKINNGYRKGLEAIILSDADIIGTQETRDNVSGSNHYQAERLASDLGWYYVFGINSDGDSGIISRYPISSDSTVGIAKKIKVTVTSNPLREVIHYNCHLDYVHYGPYEAQKPGATAAKVLTEELKSRRDEEIAAIMSGMASDLANSDNIPVMLTGDFNAPSHLDWTPEAAADHGGVSGVAWPVSTAVHGAGMSDSFRDVHPDPVTYPGYSWSPLHLGDPQDRIDFIYYRGAGLTPVASEHFHTDIEVTLGPWGVSITPAFNNTWPSDHGAILTTFKLAAIDSDGDGLSDAFENKYFGGIVSQNGSGDADGDGASNHLEQILGSSPIEAADFPVQTVDAPVLLNDPTVVHFQLSESSHDSGLKLLRSDVLQTWTTIWSYQIDPLFPSPQIDAEEIAPNKWNVRFSDLSSGFETNSRVFYRLSYGG